MSSITSGTPVATIWSMTFCGSSVLAPLGFGEASEEAVISGSPSSSRARMKPRRICMKEDSTAITAPSVRSRDCAPVRIFEIS